VDKAVAIVLPISAFVAAGFEHSVADMYIIPLGMMVQATASGRRGRLLLRLARRSKDRSLTDPSILRSRHRA
jgi:hypothetical protein